MTNNETADAANANLIAAAMTQVVAAQADPPAPKAPPKKQPGLGPRWSYILTRGFVVASVWGFFTYAFDPLLKQGTVYLGQQSAGAKVDLAKFETKFFPPRLNIEKVAVANARKPLTNVFEFANLRGDVDGFALMKGSYIIDKATITDIKWSTPRADSGLLPGYVLPPVDPNAVDYLEEAEKLGKDFAKNLIDRAKLEYDPRHFETVRLGERLEGEWTDEFEGLEAKVKKLEAEIKAIQKDVKAAKKGDTIAQIENYTKLADQGLKMVEEVDRLRKELEQLPNKAKGDLKSLDEARKRDTAEIRKKINDLTLDSDKLSDFLLGPTLNHRVQDMLAWLKWTNGRVDEFAHPPKPERFRGEDIEFPRSRPLPKHLVRLIEVTGQGDVGGDLMSLKGTISDVTSEPKLHGKPTIMRFEGHGEADIDLKATFDRTQDVPLNEIDIEYALGKPITADLGDKDSFFIRVEAQSSKWIAFIKTEGEELSGHIQMTQKSAKFEPIIKDKIDERLQRLIVGALSGINKVDAVVTLSGTVSKPKMKLKTNLGPAISEGIRDAIGNELSIQQDALVAQLDAKFKEKKTGFINKFNGKYGGIAEQLNLHEVTVKDLVPKPSQIALDPKKFEGLKKIFR